MKKTISLCMIVKNESHIIHECLESVYKHIDYWVISDTGSTDNTQKIIKSAQSLNCGRFFLSHFRLL